MEKLDLYREHKAEYAAKKTPVLIDVGPALYLEIEGQGAPGGETFEKKMGALYGVAFTIKMTRKFAGLDDYKVCGLEGLWWTDRRGADFLSVPREQWRWTLIIRTPEFVTEKDVRNAKAALRTKGRGPEVEEVRLAKIEEGSCVQILHVGPYESEMESIRLMDSLVAEKQLKRHGKHHELYLSDPRRVAPQKLRTILRHPVKRT